jgi:hypothetical protein
MKDYKWATDILGGMWNGDLQEAKEEGKLPGFEGFPPVVRKYEKSLKLFLEVVNRHGDMNDFLFPVQGEAEEFFVELTVFCKQFIKHPPHR